MAPTPPLLLAVNMTLPHQLAIMNTANFEITDPWSLHEDRQAGIFAWSIMGLIFVLFLGMVFRDMWLKSRTGELRDEAKGCKELLFLLLMMPFMIFTKRNIKALCTWIANIFRSQENKRGGKMAGTEGTLMGEHENAAVIERLGGGSTKSATSSEKGEDKALDSKSKTAENGSLPKVPGFDTEKAIPKGHGLPPIPGLPAVFEVPKILPAIVEEGHSNGGIAKPELGPSSSDSPSLSLGINLGLLEAERQRSSNLASDTGSSTKVGGSSTPASRHQSHGSSSASPAPDDADPASQSVSHTDADTGGARDAEGDAHHN
ncbi:hypothetical protein DER45DRAFT_534666 [Fusarium avenaceum]|nr:hypothetical protein DER45DRAFT_534666 [Fusarium avenaceum]